VQSDPSFKADLKKLARLQRKCCEPAELFAKPKQSRGKLWATLSDFLGGGTRRFGIAQMTGAIVSTFLLLGTTR
jgi:hypothetical protein